MITIVKIFGVNLSAIPYILVFMSDGSAYAFNVLTSAQILIANPGTFSNSGPGDVAVWEGTIALIVDPAFGYFRWPGSAAGSSSPSVELIPAPTVTAGAAGNVDIGSHRWAITFVINTVESNLGNISTQLTLAAASHVQLTNIPVGIAGTTARKIYRTAANQTGPFKLVTTIADNTTTSLDDNTADSGLGANSPSQGTVDAGSHQWAVSFLAGAVESSLSDPSVILTIGQPSTVLVYNLPLGPGGTTARNIYRTSANTPNVFQLDQTLADNTTTEISDTIPDSSLGATFGGATSNLVSLLDATKIGTTLAVFAGRVWIASNRTTQFTAPNSFTDFSILNSAGSFVMTDSNFVGPITKLLTALDVLWIFGESAINQLSNVTVLANTTTTTFSNINVSSSVGTIFPQSVVSFLRQLEFATKYGIIQQIGVTPQRVSEKIDGTYHHLDLQQPVTAGLIVLNNILCYGLMVTYLDPDNGGAPRKIILLVSFDGKWFIGSQGDGLRLMTSVETGGTYRMFGADSNNLQELFVQPHYPVHKLKTPFFDGGDVTMGKEMVRLMMVMFYDTGTADDLNPTTIEITCTPQTALAAKRPMDATKSNELILTGAQGSPIVLNSPGGNIQLLTKGYNLPVWMVGANSKLIGFDMSLDSDPFEILAYAIDVIDRESWGDMR
jgi:hypothetical protein